MECLKHSLIAAVLMLAMMPCGHAAEHGPHDHDHDAAVEICAAPPPACDCHSCDHGVCPAELQAPQQRSVSTSVLGPLPSVVTRLILLEKKSLTRHRQPPSTGVLAILQTVQLLI